MELIPAMFYNFMPPHASFRPIDDEQTEESCPPQEESPCDHSSKHQKPPGSDLLGELTGGIRDTLGGIFKDFSLKNLDSGDILLLLIILFLFLEGDNLDLVIALGLMFLLGFGSEPQPST